MRIGMGGEINEGHKDLREEEKKRTTEKLQSIYANNNYVFSN
jgi:hypothetical protein